MIDWLLALVPLLLAVPGFLLLAQRVPPGEQKVVAWGFFAHTLAMISLVVVVEVIYGYGDMLSYHRTGIVLAGYVLDDPARLWDVAALIFGYPSELDDFVSGQTATRAMYGITALFELVFFESLPATCAAIACCSASAKIALYLTFRSRFSPNRRKYLAVAVVLIPSYVFWSSGLLKEGIAVSGLGWFVWSVAPAIGLQAGGVRVTRLLWAVPSGILVALTKPYLLFPLALAGAASWFIARQGRDGLAALTPFRIVAALAMAMLVTSLLDVAFPRYSSDTFVEQAAVIREMGSLHRGGSSFESVGPPDGGIFSHLVYSPLAMINVLFRPFLFEARSPLLLLSALETTVFLVLYFRLVLRLGVRRLILAVVRDPALVFCAVYVLSFSVAVGFSTTNLGALARYRSPMLPFLGLLYLGLSSLPQRSRTESRPRPSPREARRRKQAFA